MKPIILIGGGGHCKSVIEAAESSHRRILGVLDMPENVGKKIFDYTVIGTDEDISKFAAQAEFVVTVGQIKSSLRRREIAKKIEAAGGVLGVVVASTANVSRHAILGQGTVVLHGAMVNAGAVIGNNCIINTLANVEHDVVVGSYSHISTGAMVNGNCSVGSDTFVGSQSVVLNGVKICENCVIAAGAFVNKSITVSGIYVGNPAMLINK